MFHRVASAYGMTVRPLPSIQVQENSFNTAGDMQFSVNVMQVRFHGIGRHAELIGNFLVAPSAGRTR